MLRAMKRNLYTKNEVILCTYVARFGRNEFDENDIHNFSNRSLASIKLKVQNIASMLSENGYETNKSVSKLTGKPPGKKGRTTNWEIVQNFVELTKSDFNQICNEILN